MTRAIIGAGVVALACGLVAGLLATGLLNAVACHVAPPEVEYVAFVCPDTSAAVVGFGLVGAAAGGWFTWTGRLARLFRRV